MNALATNRDQVMATLAVTFQRLRGSPAVRQAAPALEARNEQEFTMVIEAVREALYWGTTDEHMLFQSGDIDDLTPDSIYISQHPVINLVQSALDEFGNATSAHGLEPFTEGNTDDVIDIVLTKLKYLLRPKPKFPQHSVLTDFRYPIPDSCTIALVSDWGTGDQGAIAVAEQIRTLTPNHVVHLGDVYPSGTRTEAERYFVNCWRDHGPVASKYWALNGNHEMISKGEGYFDVILPFCKQKASYFALENAHWRIIGLDTAYDNHELYTPQLEWLQAHIQDGAQKNILLTHHQPFSAVDVRPSRHNLGRTMAPLIASGRIHGWFWGHEHGCLIYEQTQQYGNTLFRCIGHGGKPVRLPYYKEHKYPAPALKAHFEVERPRKGNESQNGFALLNLNGDQLDVHHLTETGEEWVEVDRF